MRRFEFHTLDVFTADKFGGNPLAVFPYATGLTDADMQSIAAEINYSETTFVLPPRDPSATARIRIFTPKLELPFAGHPNVGTGYLLARHPDMMPNKLAGDQLVFEEIAGNVHITPLSNATGEVTGSSITAPQPFRQQTTIPATIIAKSVGLDEAAIQTTRTPPIVGGTGLDFAIAEVASHESLRRAQPSLDGFIAAEASHSYGTDSFSLLLFFAASDGVIYTRMFAPLGGIVEDPATGSAAAALAGLLTQLDASRDDSIHFDIRQGIEMGRPSQISVAVKTTNGKALPPVISGSCVEVISGTFRL